MSQLLSIFFVFSLLIPAYQRAVAQENDQEPYPQFPGTNAVILENNADLYIIDAARVYEIQVKHSLKLHILTEAGISYADIQLPYYLLDEAEYIDQIKAQSINKVNGKTVKTTLQKDQVFFTQESENWGEVRISMPQAKKGTIIELQYVHHYKHIRLYHFSFQENLPVVKSQFHAHIPDWTAYRFVLQGGRSHLLETLSSTKWQLQNIPALEEIPYLDNLEDYRDKIYLQLEEYISPSTGQLVKLTDSWESLTQEFFKEKYLGKQFGKDKQIHKIALALCESVKSEEEKLILLYNYVRDNIQYNGRHRFFSPQKPQDTYNARKGNSAAINILLIEMLNSVGIEAHPILLSTKDHAKVSKQYPLLTQFNHIICYANTGEKEYFLDAIHKLRPYNFLAPEDLNGQGWLLDLENPRWIDIPLQSSQKQVNATLTITEKLELEGDLLIKVKGHQAFEYRSYLSAYTETEFLKHYFGEIFIDEDLISAKIENESDPDHSLIIKLKIKSTSLVNFSDENIYFIPMLIFALDESPFTETNRVYPIDFSYPRNTSLFLMYRYPPEWQIDGELSNIKTELSGKQIKLNHVIDNPENGVLILSHNFQIGQARLSHDTYLSVKKIFELLAQHSTANIIFKR